jgi:hypothetical protein
LSEKKKRDAKAILDQLINVDIPDLMTMTMAEAKVDASVKAARVGLLSTALHHLKLLRAAFE